MGWVCCVGGICIGDVEGELRVEGLFLEVLSFPKVGACNPACLGLTELLIFLKVDETHHRFS